MSVNKFCGDRLQQKMNIYFSYLLCFVTTLKSRREFAICETNQLGTAINKTTNVICCIRPTCPMFTDYHSSRKCFC